jgi:hypothetical protein
VPSGPVLVLIVTALAAAGAPADADPAALDGDAAAVATDDAGWAAAPVEDAPLLDEPQAVASSAVAPRKPSACKEERVVTLMVASFDHQYGRVCSEVQRDSGTARSGGPTYRLSGRISELACCCSITCAVQPVIRLSTNSGVNCGMSKPIR